VKLLTIWQKGRRRTVWKSYSPAARLIRLKTGGPVGGPPPSAGRYFSSLIRMFLKLTAESWLRKPI
jgi:hypothetical protein